VPAQARVSKDSAEALVRRASPLGVAATDSGIDCRENFSVLASNFLAMADRYDYVPLAQFRTCLWPRVDR